VTRRILLAAPLAGAGALAVAFLTATLGSGGEHLVDFQNLWHAAQDVLAGRSPYRPAPNPLLPVTGDCIRSAPDCFVYPPPAAFFAVPLGLLPFSVAGPLYFALASAALVLALRLAGLRDPRCYALAFAAALAVGALQGGTLSPFLALGLAALWHFRERRGLAASSLAAVIAVKLFLWPFLVWLVATRRAGTAAMAVCITALTIIAAWAAIGFAGFSGYPELLGTLADVWQWRAYTPLALGLALGLPAGAASAAALFVGAAVLAGAVVLARRGDERRAFAVTLAAALLLSPIVWLHYFTLLLVPLATAQPHLSRAWLLPLGFLLVPGMTRGDPVVIVVGLVIAAAILAATMRSATPGAAPATSGETPT
jgi:Glycosyltransferase family 87